MMLPVNCKSDIAKQSASQMPPVSQKTEENPSQEASKQENSQMEQNEATKLKLEMKAVPLKCPFVHSQAAKPKPLWLANEATGQDLYDTLHSKHRQEIKCQDNYCIGAFMQGQSNVKLSPEKTQDEVIADAEEFLTQYYKSIKKENSTELKARIEEVRKEIETSGTYEPTIEEITFGSRMAWRNAARCIARMHWNSLEIFDCRHMKTTKEMFDALCKHIEWATNNGNIRVGLTLFDQRRKGREDFRVWNSQFLSYAGYQQEDGTIIGDPGNVDFTKFCMSLGWKGNNRKFDYLPLVLSAPGEGPTAYDVPAHLIMEVPLKHPHYPWFEELGLRWYALPAVADMLLNFGGVEFSGAPFNGWYTGPEIGTRNLCDPHRFNILEEVAQKMELDTSSNSTLWKDRALVQINIAILYSYQLCGVAIVDHHTVAESFVKFMETEQRLRGGCPSDWVWLIPPMSGSLTATFHQEMLNYHLTPSYEYQEKLWKKYLSSQVSENTKSQSEESDPEK